MILTVHIKPNAREDKLTAVLDENTIKVSVKAPAKEGKANKALIELLSTIFGVSKSEINIIRGLQTRMKHVQVSGITEEELALKLHQK